MTGIVLDIKGRLRTCRKAANRRKSACASAKTNGKCHSQLAKHVESAQIHVELEGMRFL